MTNPMSRYESLIEQQIRQAEERGEFDNLPGTGKPLPDRGEHDDEMWWVRGYLEREGLSCDALLPPSLQLAKQIERLPETVRELRSEEAVREAVGELNRQVVAYLRAPSGPQIPVRRVDVEAVLDRWRAERPTKAEQAEDAERSTRDGLSPPESGRRRWFRRR